ncbi:hypothetical protein ACFL20_00470 [Spirochaetota bacterium]
MVSNKLRKKGYYGDILYIETDSPIRPKIGIRIYGRIKGKK